MPLRVLSVDCSSCSVALRWRTASFWSMPGRISPGATSGVPPSCTIVLPGGTLAPAVAVVAGAGEGAGVGAALASLFAGGLVTGVPFRAWLVLGFALALGLAAVLVAGG